MKQHNQNVGAKNIGHEFKTKPIVQAGNDLDDSDNNLDFINRISICFHSIGKQESTWLKPKVQIHSKSMNESKKPVTSNI